MNSIASDVLNIVGNALNQKISWISIGVPRNRYT